MRKYWTSGIRGAVTECGVSRIANLVKVWKLYLARLLGFDAGSGLQPVLDSLADIVLFEG